MVTFGSPCQDLSVAGKRKGMAGERSGLFFEAIRIVRESECAFAIWENVPGAFSSNSGRDFGAVLNAFRECGARDICWRVLDAQYCGVPQRHRRIFVVADFRGERAGQILFEPQGVRGYSPKGGEAWKDVAGTFSARTKGGGGLGTDFECGGGLIPDTVGALTDGAHSGGGLTGRTPTPEESLPRIAWALQERDAKGADSDTKPGHLIPCFGGTFDVAHSLRAEGHDASEDGTGRETPLVVPTMRSNGEAHTGSGVRRLTPRECERLQGFPDDWTDVGISDSGRYRCLGNAVAVPVVFWLATRVVEVLKCK